MTSSRLQRGLRANMDKRGVDVAAMFDQVAARYDLTNDVLTFGLDRVWRAATRAAVAAKPGERVLDVAAGTGTSSVEYAKGGARVTASDFSSGMVAEAKRRHPDLEVIEADAQNLPFADETFDVVTISYGIRNVEDCERALREMARVTKPGGRLVIAEFSTPTWAPFAALYRLFLTRVLPRLASLTSSNNSSYTYLVESISKWPAQRDFARTIESAGWRGVRWRNLTGGIVALHWAERPESPAN
ncbi:demethylmenaquinone methyltransferase [Nanchangia anserum]|uniref:Demethylmenaquinone methyltransferase n=1 Tax=Nanchangia anserum TaxID=2692125 RepID=A0A8I0GEE9_9ACTO|nr:demethylmenaquinone methyltransferase [Nanchangia anserum]MBD3689337.1 demethylmenaquinone methyltransferase [Nanchangia anserum]QOX81545.1 demethylmenaquinone methyltransferase [Nanchangia anserum]